MRTALLFKDDVETIVTATQVQAGEYSRHENFVDPENKFRVTYVNDSKGHGGPYFRLYFSRDYYNSLNPDRKSKYDILRKQRHYLESAWHREWEEKFSTFCKIEYIIKNEEGDRKRADAFYLEGKTAIEFQHSYIDRDFEGRNAFYGSLGYNIVWLYDLTMMNVVPKEDGSFEILESNAKGFFRIAENPANLKDYPVFIQTREGEIFRVSSLGRKTIDDARESTIRTFTPDLVLSEEEFLQGIHNKDRAYMSNVYAKSIEPEGLSIPELWDTSYSKMVVEDIESKKQIMVFAGNDGDMMRTHGEPDMIRVSYVTYNAKSGKVTYNSYNNFYSFGKYQQLEKKWILLKAFKKGE